MRLLHSISLLITNFAAKMIFNSFNFLVLYPILFLLYYAIPAKHPNIRNLFLLTLSYALYIQWKPVYALILLLVTFITYNGALMLNNPNATGGGIKFVKTKLAILVVLAASPLIFFKYYNFINDSITSCLSSAGIQFHLPGLNLMIPVGISFFTFQALSYLWDVYYKKIEPEKNFLHYALFISFFPSIVAGPINKASLILPQIKKLRTYFDYPKAVEGLKMILWGMFMKVVVADRIAIYVDTVLDSYANYTGITCLFAALLYSIQIYADFAGYSLMAIGVGKTLGFELTENFRRPYFAVSVTDFWRRWHISLSTWLKDYVYIPMGGSRCSKIKNYWNILATFLVSGIWHGANWTFVVWGALHGIFQIIEKALGQQKCEYGSFGKAVKITITFILVTFAWIFFRMPTLNDAFQVIGRIFSLNGGLNLFIEIDTLAFVFLGLFALVFKDITDEYFPSFKLLDNKRTIVRWICYAGLTAFILLAGVFSSDQFIYANF